MSLIQWSLRSRTKRNSVTFITAKNSIEKASLQLAWLLPQINLNELGWRFKLHNYFYKWHIQCLAILRRQ